MAGMTGGCDMLLSVWGTCLTRAPAPAAPRIALSQCTGLQQQCCVLQKLKRWDQVLTQGQLPVMCCWRGLDYSCCCWLSNRLPRCCLQAKVLPSTGQPGQWPSCWR